MFQTEINHFFQSFATDGLTAFMRFITMLGYQEFFLAFLIVLFFGIHLRKGFILFLVLLWTAAITFFLKDYFDLPRPFHADNTVKLLDGHLPDHDIPDFYQGGAKGFWDPLPTEVIEATRQIPELENGFPSGHSSIAIAFWGAILFLFRKKWVQIIAGTLMLLIPVSRMYLGVHFLADVLGGILLGAMILAVFYFLILKQNKLALYLQKEKIDLGWTGITLILVLCPFLLLAVLPPRVYILVAMLVGLGLGFLGVAMEGFPGDEAPLMHRLGRILIGFLLLGSVGYGLSSLAKAAGISEIIWVSFLSNTLLFFLMVWGGTKINRNLF